MEADIRHKPETIIEAYNIKIHETPIQRNNSSISYVKPLVKPMDPQTVNTQNNYAFSSNEQLEKHSGIHNTDSEKNCQMENEIFEKTPTLCFESHPENPMDEKHKINIISVEIMSMENVFQSSAMEYIENSPEILQLKKTNESVVINLAESLQTENDQAVNKENQRVEKHQRNSIAIKDLPIKKRIVEIILLENISSDNALVHISPGKTVPKENIPTENISVENQSLQSYLHLKNHPLKIIQTDNNLVESLLEHNPKPRIENNSLELPKQISVHKSDSKISKKLSNSSNPCIQTLQANLVDTGLENLEEAISLKHKKTNKKGERKQILPFKCFQTDCNRAFETSDHLYQHKTIHQSGTRKSRRLNTSQQVKCEQCNEYFDNLILLTKHRSRHNIELPFKCLKCGKFYKTYKTLNQHKETHFARENVRK